MKILLDTGSSGPGGWSGSSPILRCPKRYRLQRLGYVEGDRQALIKGSLVHVALAHYYARLQAVQQSWDPDAYYTPLQAVALVAEKNGPAWEEHVGLAQKAANDYERRMAAYPEYVIAVEQLVEFEFPRTFGFDMVEGGLASAIAAELPETLTHRMRVDLIVQAPDSRFVVRDHKTTSNYKRPTSTPFDLSGQIVGLQWWAQREYREKYGGVEIGSVGLTNEKIEFLRPKLAPNAVAEWPKMRTYIEVLKRVNRALYGDSLDWPMAMSDQGPCLDRYGPCGFRDPCRMGLAT